MCFSYDFTLSWISLLTSLEGVYSVRLTLLDNTWSYSTIQPWSHGRSFSGSAEDHFRPPTAGPETLLHSHTRFEGVTNAPLPYRPFVLLSALVRWNNMTQALNRTLLKLIVFIHLPLWISNDLNYIEEFFAPSKSSGITMFPLSCLIFISCILKVLSKK